MHLARVAAVTYSSFAGTSLFGSGPTFKQMHPRAWITMVQNCYVQHLLLALWDRAQFFMGMEGEFRNTQKMQHMHSWLWERPAAIKTICSLQWTWYPFV